MKKKPVEIRRVIHIKRWEMRCEECREKYLAERRGRSRFCSEGCQYRAWARVHRPKGKPRQKAAARAR